MQQRVEITDLPAASPAPTLLLRKVRAVLDCFLPYNEPLSLTEVHRRTDLPISTTLRILRSLVEEGFLVHPDGMYRLGVSLMRWSAAASNGLRAGHATGQVLNDLRDRTGETITLCVNDGLQRVCVAVAPSRQRVVHLVHVGDAVPLHGGAAGKVLLAWDPAATHEVLRHGLSRLAERTITDPQRLTTELARVRRQGWATSQSETAIGTASVAAPVFDASGRVVAAVVLGGPVQRVNRKLLLDAVPAVTETARRLSEDLAWSGDRPDDDSLSRVAAEHRGLSTHP
jgi:IclR family acetate operon transcriptional repressor